jgi:hypothetical protein
MYFCKLLWYFYNIEPPDGKACLGYAFPIHFAWWKCEKKANSSSTNEARKIVDVDLYWFSFRTYFVYVGLNVADILRKNDYTYII